MIHYKLAAPEPTSHFLVVEMSISNINSEIIEVQLPAWRPGRYELQNFAKNISSFEVFDLDNQPLSFRKITKDRWQINTKGQALVLKYQYYANLLNAGSSFIDDTQWYINFVNCLPYVEGRIDESCRVSLDMPKHYKVACGITEISKFEFLAKDFYELADCPLMASATLRHQSYTVANAPDTNFHLWFQSSYKPDFEQITNDFAKFTALQLEKFCDIPCQDYHFLIHILPVPYYHGVEHRNSTVIVLGPDTQANEFYPDLLGVCSHELYHTWNICKIRPKELLPYNFTQENYFYTGFVAEGVTTYMGDLFLVQSGVFTEENYLLELGATLKKHFEKDGKAFQSLAESSYDLWLDGYVQAIPNRRVSIYSKGAVVALMLDLKIRQKTIHAKSLHDVMKLMWERFGKPFVGYDSADYQAIAEEVYGESLVQYFEDCIWSNIPLQSQLNELLAWVGLSLKQQTDQSYKLEILDIENIDRQRWLCI